MIKLFGITDTTFTSNGDKVVVPLRANVHKEDNGDYYLDLTTSLDYINDLTEGRIVIAPTPQGDQAFRVGNVEKTKYKLTTRCWHVFYDTQNYLIFDSYVVDKSCGDALDHLNSATTPASPFTTLSDVGTIDSYRCIRKSEYEAIQTVLERWGGHLVRDNFTIKIMGSTGQDNGVTVRYAKNLQTITCQENWDNVVTQLLPVGYNGIMLDDPYLYADVTYEVPYTKTVSFNQEISEEDYQDAEGQTDQVAFEAALKEDLLAQAQAYLNINQYPQVNYTITANLEKITDIGDTIQVIDERLGVNVLTNVLAYDYDCILEKYTQIEFGNFKKTLSGLVSNITASTNQAIEENNGVIQSTITSGLQQAQEEILNALGSSEVVVGDGEILILDRLPQEEAVNVIKMNSGGIAFSQNGINGNFQSAWTIDNVLNMEQINVINLVADLIKGGTLKLGSNLNQNGQLELYDEANNLIGQMTKDGFKMYGTDGSYVLMNNTVGVCGYDRNGNAIWWTSQDEFHQKKSVIEEEITLCNRARFIQMTLTDNNNNITNDGIGLVSVPSSGITMEASE